ncbi:MAG: hypothetical protein ACTSR8_06580 [Promethearchaeota archaeon]
MMETNLIADKKIDFESDDGLEDQGLNTDNSFEGLGSPWNVTHWANRTDTDIALSFNEGSTDTAEMPLGGTWEGYQLDAEVSNLYDNRNWCNGTMSYGNDDGDYTSTDDDTAWIDNPYQKWEFTDGDANNQNDMAGNYLNSSYGPADGQDCLQLRMSGRDVSGNYNYEQGDYCSWNSTFSIPRGRVINSILEFAYNPNNLADFNSWEFSVSIGSAKIYSIGTYSLRGIAGEGNWNTLSIPMGLWINSTPVFSNPVQGGDINIFFKLEYIAATATYSSGFYHISYQEIFFDNVSLITQAEALPTQLGLEINGTSVINNGYGKGTATLTGHWENSKVFMEFSCNDVGLLGSYQVELKTNLNIYATNPEPETLYETNYASEGTLFSVENNTIVDWDFYTYLAVLNQYEETIMKIEFPVDVNITWVSDPQDPGNNKLDQCDNSTQGIILIPVNTISATPNGYWRFKAKSPNYCNQMSIYKNTTVVPTGTDWAKDSTFLSGDYINITLNLYNSPVVSSYIDQTQAQLQIRFPNGTLWASQSQVKTSDSNGLVKFDIIQVPDTPPNYEVGVYEIILTWNNSYSTNGLNETGIFYSKITITHDSVLVPDQNQYLFDDVQEDSKINIKVSFNDIEDGTAIQNAQVYVYNFTDPLIENYFSEISPGFYLLEFNVSGAVAGNNLLTVYANSSLYINKKIDITIHVIKDTTLTAEEYPIVQVIWNENFTIHLNYTETSTGNGIDTTPTNNWLGETYIEMGDIGEFNITLNSTLYAVNQIHSLIIDVDETGYESQSILIKVEVLERNTYYDTLYLNGTDKTATKSISIPWNEALPVAVVINDSRTDSFISAITTLSVTGPGGINVSLVEGAGIYSGTIPAGDLPVGTNSLTISGAKDNFTLNSLGITVIVKDRATYYDTLYLNGTDKTATKSISIPWNEALPVAVVINDSRTDSFISGITTLAVTGPGGINIPLVEGAGIYSGTIPAGDLPIGSTSLTISGTKDNYTLSSLGFTVIINNRETYYHKIYLNGTDKTATKSISIPWNEALPVAVVINDSRTDAFIDGIATLTLTGTGINIPLVEGTGIYTCTIPAGDLSVGTNSLTISGAKDNFTLNSLGITVIVKDRATYYDMLYLNGTDKTATKSITLPWYESLSIGIVINDSRTDVFIGGITTFLLSGSGISIPMVEGIGIYTCTIPAGELHVGTTSLSISGSLNNYTIGTLGITVIVTDRATYYDTLYLNGTDKSATKSISIPWNEDLPVAVVINDSRTDAFIDGITDLTLTGPGGINILLVEGSGSYTCSIPAGELLPGTTILSISGTKDNYTINTLGFTVIVTDRAAYFKSITLNATDNRFTNGQDVNITVEFYDLADDYFIPNAEIYVKNGTIELGQLIQNGNQYTIVLNTTVDLGAQSAITLTLSATEDNYTLITDTITIYITERGSNYSLITNIEGDITGPLFIQRNVNQTIELQYVLRDKITKAFLSGATVTIKINETWYDLDEQLGYYNITFEAKDLPKAYNNLIIQAMKNGYVSTQIILEVEIIERETDITLFIGEDIDSLKDITNEPSEKVTYTETFMIAVNYTDLLTGSIFSGGAVELLGDYEDDLTLDPTTELFIITIDSSDLNLGINFITVFASRENYEAQKILLQIEILRIQGEIVPKDDKSTIKAEPGQDITISIELRNVDFGGKITGATITFTSNMIRDDLREGEFEEVSDGVYEITLENLPEGTYILIISVTFKDEEKLRTFDVEQYEITLDVVRPQEDVLLFQIISIIGIAGVIGLGAYLIAYQKVLKYPKPVRKVRNYRKDIKKKKPSEKYQIQDREEAFNERYASKLMGISKLLKNKAKVESKPVSTIDKIDKTLPENIQKKEE